MKWPVQLHSSSAANDLQLLHKIQSIAKRPSSVVALARRSVYSPLLITNRSFSYTSIYLWNQLPSSFRHPHSVHSSSGSPHLARITSSQSQSYHVSLPRPLTPDLKLMCFTNLFLRSLSDFAWIFDLDRT